ncbi:hypothetical protein EJ06DRAFT_585331 [Trichodelitschia bisporula]|uniref:Uncharacterized protein n=1 Tax=Trichodelitschia bisporula TaxID=703511 RepID=A0A6G1HKF6_9PEZI|nr:hypothetical protein EJ06DRAFT_585331 [Trichodelitschia bisporula]
MSGLKDFAKGGWHPKNKDGSSESWRKDFPGVNKVAGLMGKGKDPHAAALDHQSTPLSSLTDPSTFGPPPKRDPRRPLPPPAPRAAPSPAPAPEQPAPPPRASTVPSTTGLPTPPRRTTNPPRAPPPVGAKPSALPPRLPPRPTSTFTSPPPPYTPAADPSRGIMNPSALDGLSRAGVSVAGLGIGRTASPPVPARRTTASPPAFAGQTTGVIPPPTLAQPTSPGPQMGGLAARFGRLGTGDAPAPAAPAPGRGTSFAEKQAALRTASALKSNPGSVSLADARSAAGVAGNFQQRHGAQVAAGWQRGQGLAAKYGGGATGQSEGAAATGAAPGAGVPGGPPPPIPPKPTQW